jgi:hypothetical protein
MCQTDHPRRQKVFGGYPFLRKLHDLLLINLFFPVKNDIVKTLVVDYNIVHSESKLDFHTLYPPVVSKFHVSVGVFCKADAKAGDKLKNLQGLDCQLVMYGAKAIPSISGDL